MRSRARGSALAAVLAGSILLLLLCLLAASFSLSQLDFSRNFRDHNASDQLARAAMAQFLANERRNGAADDPLGSRGSELSRRYTWQSLFGNDSARLGGIARIGFTPQPGGTLCSFDNSASALFAHGCLDAPDEKTVPPFAAQLLVQVEIGSQVTWYECVMRRAWPYAVTTRDPITLAGNPSGGNPKAPTSIEGDILCLPPRTDEPSGSQPFWLSPPQMMAMLTQLGAQTFGGVSVGGPVSPYATVPLSAGNRLDGDGDVDFAFQDPAQPPQVVVAQGNIWTGTSRLGVGFKPELLGQILGDAGKVPDDAQKLMRVTGSGAPVYHTNGGREFYFMEQSLLLTDLMPENPPPDTHVEVGGTFRLEGSLGNSFIPVPLSLVDDHRVRVRTLSRLTLHNTRLFVDGDLTLRGTGTETVLVGDNATLVVSGTLTVEGGALDAGDQGMVISCGRLLMKASGDYRGLIMVNESALFYPSIEEPPGGADPILSGFSIRGGLVVGGVPLSTAERGADPQDGAFVPRPPVPSGIFPFRGLGLFSVGLIYDPGYLKPLHHYGQFQTLTFRRLP